MLKYEGIVRDAIIKYKFDEKAYLYKTFAKIILNDKKICRFLKTYDIIMPVPMHKRKMDLRGYNQTELIAREIANILNLKMPIGALIKIKDTTMQSTLNLAERKENVKGVYKATDGKIFEGKNVIIFDDIFTTGNTALEVAKVIKKAGAKNIIVLAIAKD
ncbi:MAG: ComF family protein [Clostridia bacterium]